MTCPQGAYSMTDQLTAAICLIMAAVCAWLHGADAANLEQRRQLLQWQPDFGGQGGFLASGFLEISPTSWSLVCILAPIAICYMFDVLLSVLLALAFLVPHHASWLVSCRNLFSRISSAI